jgi:hypothetical protein
MSSGTIPPTAVIKAIANVALVPSSRAKMTPAVMTTMIEDE